MTQLIQAIQANVSSNLWLIIAAAWGFFHVKAKIREAQGQDDERLSKQIHAGLNLWINNGGGAQVRRIVREEMHEAVEKHQANCPWKT